MGRLRSPVIACVIALWGMTAQSVLSATRTETVRGWRVQLINTLDRDEARAVAERARELIAGDSVEVVFQTPWWRVRAGSFANRDDAEKLLARVDGIRAFDAFVVPAQVEVDVQYAEAPEPRRAPRSLIVGAAAAVAAVLLLLAL